MVSGSSSIPNADTGQLPDNADGDHPVTNGCSTSRDEDERSCCGTEQVNDIQPVTGDGETSNSLPSAPEDEPLFTLFDLFWAIAGLVLYVIDIYSDIRLAVLYFLEGQVWYGAVTLTFVLLAYIVTVALALYKYHKDSFFKHTYFLWCCRTALTVLMLGHFVRSYEYVYNGYKARTCTQDKNKQNLYKRKMERYHWLNCFLAMFEACIQAAPQLVFQLYVLLVTKSQLESVDGLWRVFTLLTSWFSLALALTTYKKSERNIDYQNSTWHNLRYQTFDLLWRLPETGGRVLCIACFASVFRFFVLEVVISHVLIMVVWQYLKQENTSPLDIILYFVHGGGAYLFAFYNKYWDTNFRLQSIAFYLLFYLENFTMLLLWYFYTPDQGAWFHTPILIAGFLSLPLHVLLQLLYNKCCHPSSHKIQACIPCGLEQWNEALCVSNSVLIEKRTKKLQSQADNMPTV